MRRVKSKNTKPEMVVRSLVHRLGFRFRLHRSDLPGKPDLVFPSRRKVIFVNGCFWHAHDCPHGANRPKTNVEYWKKKLDRNKITDEKNRERLRELGWESLVIWECRMKDQEKLKAEIVDFLDPPPARS